MEKLLEKREDLGLLIIRIAIGVLMLFHGFAKVQAGPAHVEHMLVGAGLPGILAYGVYLLEIIAPIFVIIGWRTRLWAVVYVLGMLVILYVANGSDIFALAKTGALKAEVSFFYTLNSLALFFTGGGKYALSNKSKWD